MVSAKTGQQREGASKVFLRLLATRAGEVWPGDLASVGGMGGKDVSEVELAGGTYLPGMGCVLAVGPWEPGMVWVRSFLGRHILGKWHSAALKNRYVLKPTAAPTISLNQISQYLVIVLGVLTAWPGK